MFRVRILTNNFVSVIRIQHIQQCNWVLVQSTFYLISHQLLNAKKSNNNNNWKLSRILACILGKNWTQFSPRLRNEVIMSDRNRLNIWAKQTSLFRLKELFQSRKTIIHGRIILRINLIKILWSVHLQYFTSFNEMLNINVLLV